MKRNRFDDKYFLLKCSRGDDCGPEWAKSVHRPRELELRAPQNTVPWSNLSFRQNWVAPTRKFGNWIFPQWNFLNDQQWNLNEDAPLSTAYNFRVTCHSEGKYGVDIPIRFSLFLCLSQGKTPLWKDHRGQYRNVHRLVLKPSKGPFKWLYVYSNRTRIGGMVLALILQYIHFPAS